MAFFATSSDAVALSRRQVTYKIISQTQSGG